jgi:hypothetical protein
VRPPGEEGARRFVQDEAPAGLTVYRADDLKLQSPIRTAGELPKLAEDMGAKVLRIQGIVDREGRFREPVVLGEGSPDTIYRVLEALREWRYTAAQRNYRSVASFRSVYVGNLPPPEPLLRLGYPSPKPGPQSRGPANPARRQTAPVPTSALSRPLLARSGPGTRSARPHLPRGQRCQALRRGGRGAARQRCQALRRLP